jgi:hypothetical protein
LISLFFSFIKIKICEISLPYILDHLFSADEKLAELIGKNINFVLNEGKK